MSKPLVNVSVPLTVELPDKVTPLPLLILRFGTVAVSSGPVVCAALPLYSSVALIPLVWGALAVAVPCIDKTPFTNTPMIVFVPEPARVRF